ncbi:MULTISPECIES: hypothetical protein [unclassified Micromonospora]
MSLKAAGGFGLSRGVDLSYQQLVANLGVSFRSWPRARVPFAG